MSAFCDTSIVHHENGLLSITAMATFSYDLIEVSLNHVLGFRDLLPASRHTARNKLVPHSISSICSDAVLSDLGVLMTVRYLYYTETQVFYPLFPCLRIMVG